jgi:hypothetical protein
MTDTPAQYSKVQRRLLTALGGLGVVALATATFVLSYGDLRALAIQGGAVRHRAYLYPGVVDGLVVVVILSILTARRSRWISRALRWLLLLLLVGGAGTAGVWHAIRGYGRLSHAWVSGGVAAAPWAILVIAVWLWLAMIKQALGLRPRRDRSASAPEPTAAIVDQAIVPGFADPEPQETRELVRATHVRELEAVRTTEPEPMPAGVSMDWLDPAPSTAPLEPMEWQPAPAPTPTGARVEPEVVPDTPVVIEEEPEDVEPVPFTAPTSLPTDVMLVGGPRPKPDLSDTQPDGIKLPDTRPDGIKQVERTGVEDDEADEADADERAEDPDAGETERDEDAEMTPPFGQFRSSPTPPRD